MSTLKRKADSQAGADAKKTRPNGSITDFFGAPESSPLPKGSPVVFTPHHPPVDTKFDKAKWVSGLTNEQRELLQLEIDTLHESWLAHLKDDITTREFLELKKFLNRESAAKKNWFPPAEDVYSWSRHTPFPTVKVVILGQDPYHNDNQAHGLAFSVRAPTPAPPSLKNMYTCLKNDYPSFVPPPNGAGLLTPWADRGVLMLNTCLTVRAHEANSHSNRGWERFTQRVIDLVAAKRTRGVVFIAWGTPAGKRVGRVDQKRHLVLKAVHPSPLSAARGYFTCGHFRKANDWLAVRYGKEGVIDWALVEGSSTKETVLAKEKVGAEAVLAGGTGGVNAQKVEVGPKIQEVEETKKEILKEQVAEETTKENPNVKVEELLETQMDNGQARVEAIVQKPVAQAVVGNEENRRPVSRE